MEVVNEFPQFSKKVVLAIYLEEIYNCLIAGIGPWQ